MIYDKGVFITNYFLQAMENAQEDMNKCEGCDCKSCPGGSECCGQKRCNCPHHKAIPVCIMLIAITFLLGAWGILSEGAVSVIWPVLLLVIGGTKLMKNKCTCC